MTKIRVDTITNAAGTGAPNIPDGITIGGVALASINSLEYTESASEPATPKDGAIWWDTGNDKFFQYMNSAWVEVSYTNPLKRYGDTAVVLENANYSPSNTMSQFSIVTGGNATDFGDNTLSRSKATGFGNSVYGLFAGGSTGTPTNTIDYVTIATPGNATDFGDMTTTTYSFASHANPTRGVYGGGLDGATTFNTIEYVTIDTPGNGTDFGDLTVARWGLAATGDDTYALFAGGYSTGGYPAAITNIIDYIAVGTLSNATDFGDLIRQTYRSGGMCSDDTYAVLGGNWYNWPQDIQYVAIATPGNASDFGDLTGAIADGAATTNNTNGVFTGGYSNQGTLGYGYGIDKIVIATPGNATDFGNLTQSSQDVPAATSGN